MLNRVVVYKHLANCKLLNAVATKGV